MAYGKPWKKLPTWKNSSLLQYHAGRPLASLKDHALTARHLSASTILTPPAVFIGLLLSLWTYKCAMMVVFQNKIIYMPSVPPFSRSEKVETYARSCMPAEWTKHELRSLDGTRIVAAVGKLPRSSPAERRPASQRKVIVYFQGNASSLPPRLGFLSSVLKGLIPLPNDRGEIDHEIVALSYRGFWTSKGRPTQRGIELDAAAILDWICTREETQNNPTTMILWGQSIGAGVATNATARYIQRQNVVMGKSPNITGLLLETPFVSIKDMLIALYPQKWLPYRYLGPFLRNHWNSREALEIVAAQSPAVLPKVLLLTAGSDELVPEFSGIELEEICKINDITVTRQVIPRALHTEVMLKEDGIRSAVDFIRKC
jgi:pimeloyl-ACP methyl ester carboxylesterase